jgi:hypothetical protein
VLGRFAARAGQVWVGFGGEQQLDQGGIAVATRERERRHAVSIGLTGDRAGRQERAGLLGVVVVGGPKEGGHAVRLGGVHLGCRRGQQLREGGVIAPLGRFGEGGGRGVQRGCEPK